ncbi:MAG: hypothetical protein ACLFV8_03620 [Alphaproteobacteria bacterium]
MHIVAHRRNTVEELRATPRRFGVEVDIRSQGPDLVIHHDPFTEGVSFEDWLNAYEHGLLILNTKEEGLEERLLACMAEKGQEDFFFLDQSFPFLIRTARAGEPRCAVRVSEYEAPETALALAGMVRWVWVDSFTRWPLGAAEAARLRRAGFKLCAVSPELHGRTADGEVTDLQRLLAREGIALDAVCTKKPALWEAWRT